MLNSLKSVSTFNFSYQVQDPPELRKNLQTIINLVAEYFLHITQSPKSLMIISFILERNIVIEDSGQATISKMDT